MRSWFLQSLRPKHSKRLMAGLSDFAQTISSQALGLAFYRPEGTALPTHCFENVLRKVDRDGGRIQFGWTFGTRLSSNGEYLIATHHAVWHAPIGQLIDVTPMHEEERHRPITHQGDILFLVDDLARPVQTKSFMAPLPSRFFALDDTAKLNAYVAHLQQDEDRACQVIYDSYS
jgi:hypothetical protein